MLKTLQIPAVAGLLVLAGAGTARAGGIQCAVPEAPTININPVSEEIQYDFSQSSRALAAMKAGSGNTSSPYPAGTDTATGGLRADQPIVSINVEMGNEEYPSQRLDCLWYHDVTVTITLRPHIYIAKEYNLLGPCRDAIMAHELHHVDVDREMMNKYAYVIGETVRDAVNRTGALGPFGTDDLDTFKQNMVDQAKSAVLEKEPALRDELNQRQAQVDSLDEYKRISAICYNAENH